MQTDTRYHLSGGRLFRLVVRLLGITGIVVTTVGAFLLYTTVRDLAFDRGMSYLKGDYGHDAQLAAYLIACGGAVVALWLLIDVLTQFAQGAGRSATGMNAMGQAVLAIAIVAALNVYSFLHYERWDTTRDKQFTLPDHVVSELKKLRSPTTILVLQQHKTFGRLSGKPDAFDYAAERKVVEKVRDLVSEFQELGRQFRVVVLDIEEEGYDRRLREETADKPALAAAIREAPENSIFFYSDGRVQRMSFNEFYQLDKTASKEANGGRGNLVLKPQGIDTFARRILAIQEKKPKVVLAVIHEVLTSSSSEDAPDQYIHTGLRKALEAHGFEVTDLILKRWTGEGPPEPAAYNKSENRVDELSEELEGIAASVRQLREERKQSLETQELMRDPAAFFRKKSREAGAKDPTDAEVRQAVEGLRRQFRSQTGRDLDEGERKRQIAAFDEDIKRIVSEDMPKLESERRKREEELQKLLGDERALADRRVSDVRAKMKRALEDCDLLIVPRQTLMNIHANLVISPRVHALTDSPDSGMPFAERAARSRQVEVIREFIRRGKPVLACVGPINDRRGGPPEGPLDDFERALMERGVELGRQTVLFNAEERDFAAAIGEDSFGTGGRAEIPQVEFVATPGPDGKVNPIAQAMVITGRNVDQKLDIRLRHPRPIYVLPAVAAKMPFPPEFMRTSPDSWNESRPFPEVRLVGGRELQAYIPRFQATPPTDPKKNTRDEERRGPFPIGVAIESPAPIEWADESFAGYKELAGVLAPFDGVLAAGLTVRAGWQPDTLGSLVPQTERKTSRLVVIGHGGVFAGKELSPATEMLLLNTTNWLLGREDRLPHESGNWSYPRVQLNEKQKSLWVGATVFGLPMLFLYLGLMVLMLRRVR